MSIFIIGLVVGFVLGSVSSVTIMKHKNTQIQISTSNNSVQTQIIQ